MEDDPERLGLASRSVRSKPSVEQTPKADLGVSWPYLLSCDRIDPMGRETVRPPKLLDEFVVKGLRVRSQWRSTDARGGKAYRQVIRWRDAVRPVIFVNRASLTCASLLADHCWIT